MKSYVALQIVGMIALCGVAASAQQPPNPPSAPQPATPARAVALPRPAAPPTTAQAASVEPGGQVVNIRLDVSISDQAGAAPVRPKVLTLLLADRNGSQLRTNFDDRYISMDARPTIVDGKIKLTLAMSSDNPRPGGQFVPVAPQPFAPGQTGGATMVWNQSLTVIVESGKPLVVVENSDPANNRKLSVEVKATIIK
jgi:hypothetical protein